ncbi:MAG TPA: MBL fold metallo-hydrolase [Herpetosiphonaceae bacterium]|nr:MBL fold metallo-hydrolase [Herpetosiphonaceae bacterium]
MREIARDVHLLGAFPAYAINVYMLGDILVDAATRLSRRRILRELRGRTVRTHMLTHAHGDHQGASHAVCTELNLPLWCGAGDAAGMASGDLSAQIPRNLVTRIQERFWVGPPHPVARELREGDQIGEWTVIETPGHSPGHVVFWRESDRTLIAGDVLVNMNLLTTRPGLAEPPLRFTMDPALNRASVRKLKDLRPQVVCFGHGPPLRDPGRFADFISGLA